MSYAPATPEKARIAWNNGAAGTVLSNWGTQEEDVICMLALKAARGNPTTKTFKQIALVYAVTISRPWDEHLQGLCQEGKVAARILVSSPKKWDRLCQPYGLLKGTAEPDKFVLVSGHLDAWEPGAACNATEILRFWRTPSQAWSKSNHTRGDIVGKTRQVVPWLGDSERMFCDQVQCEGESELIEGRVFSFWLLMVVIGVILYSMWRARTGNPVRVRRLAALDAIDEAIGRATEMGKPVHFCPGLAPLTGLDAPQTLSAMVLLGYVAKLTARFDVPLIVTIRQPDVFSVAQETVRQAYQEEGKTDKYIPTNIRFLSNQQFAYATAASGIIMREKVAANFLIGAFWAENLMLAEVGCRVNAFQISGTASIGQVPLFVPTTDFVLIGEELYAASAYLSQDVVQLGSIRGQDLCKVIALALLLAGIVAKAIGSDYFISLLSK